MLEGCDIASKDITGDALLTQRALARHIVERHAHYHFPVKGNQPTLARDIALLFETRGVPDFVEVMPPKHGRRETRRIGCSTALNATLDFPYVGQVFLIERESIDKKTGVHSVISRWGSQVARHHKPRRNASSRSIAGIGASKASITSSTGTTMRIAAKARFSGV